MSNQSANPPVTGGADPIPEFRDRCYAVRVRWIKGELPFEEALSLLNTYQQEAVESGHLANQALVEYQLGYIHHYRGKIDQSIEHYQRALAIFEQVGNREYTARVNLNLGSEYQEKGIFHKALDQYQLAYAQSGEIGDLSMQLFAAVNSGDVLFRLEMYDPARQAFERGEELARQLTDDYWQKQIIVCELYCGLSTVFLKQHDANSAWASALKALEAARRDDQPRSRGVVNRLLGILISEFPTVPDQSFSTNPDEYFQKSLDAYVEIDAEPEIARTLVIYAQSLKSRGRPGEAAEKAQQAIRMFRTLGMTDEAMRVSLSQLGGG